MTPGHPKGCQCQECQQARLQQHYGSNVPPVRDGSA